MDYRKPYISIFVPMEPRHTTLYSLCSLFITMLTFQSKSIEFLIVSLNRYTTELWSWGHPFSFFSFCFYSIGTFSFSISNAHMPYWQWNRSEYNKILFMKTFEIREWARCRETNFNVIWIGFVCHNHWLNKSIDGIDEIHWIDVIWKHYVHTYCLSLVFCFAAGVKTDFVCDRIRYEITRHGDIIIANAEHLEQKKKRSQEYQIEYNRINEKKTKKTNK